MADENVKVTQTTETNAENQQVETNAEETTSIEDLMSQLAEAKANAEKYKLANDKLSKSEAEMKRQLRAKLTAEEQQAIEMAEAQRIRDEEFEAMKAELNHNKAVTAYRNLSNEKSVESLIEAVSDSDHNAIASIIEAEIKYAVKQEEAKWMASRPQVGGNAYSTMTKDQIMAIKDRSERQRAIAMNLEAFNK